MHKQFYGLMAALFLIVLPLRAQTPSLTSSQAPLQVGFLVITPTDGNGAGLAAFETIGNLQSTGFQTAVIPAAALKNNGTVVIDLTAVSSTPNQNGGTPGTAGISVSGGRGAPLFGQGQDLPNGSTQANGINGAVGSPTTTVMLTSTGATPVGLFDNTAISIINPNQTPATISATLNIGQGTVIPLPTFTLGPLQEISKFVNELLDVSTSIPLPVSGVINFTSDIPIGITALEFRGNTFATVPVASVGVNGPSLNPQVLVSVPLLLSGVGGAGALLLPQFVTGGGFTSQVTIVNLSGTAQTVRADLFSSDGTLLSTTTSIQIPPNSVFNFGQ